MVGEVWEVGWLTTFPRNGQGSRQCTVIKGYRFSRPQLECHKPNFPWQGISKFFPARESLVSDIPAGDGKIDSLFYSVGSKQVKVEGYV